MEYGYQGLDPGLKVSYLLNGIRCDKLYTAVARVRAHPDKYKKEFDAIVVFLTHYINKRAPSPSMKVASLPQTCQVAEKQHYPWHYQGHPDKYEKDFDVVVQFLTQYINKRAPTPSVKVAFLSQNRPAKWQKTRATHGTFKGKIELKKYSNDEYASMLMAQHQQLYKLQKKTWLINGKETPESSRALEARVAAFETKNRNQ